MKEQGKKEVRWLTGEEEIQPDLPAVMRLKKVLKLCESDNDFESPEPLDEVFFAWWTITNTFSRWALEDAKSKHGKAAARWLAEMGSKLGKWDSKFQKQNETYRKRKNQLKPKDLLASDAEVARWMINISLEASSRVSRFRLLQEIEVAEYVDSLDEESKFALSLSETIRDLDLIADSKTRVKAIFDSLLWPMILERKNEIEKEAWAEKRIHRGIHPKSIGRQGQWNSNFSNLKSDFFKAWKAIAARKNGELIGIEFPRIL